jgi:hypothetical protein
VINEMIKYLLQEIHRQTSVKLHCEDKLRLPTGHLKVSVRDKIIHSKEILDSISWDFNPDFLVVPV